MYREKFVIQSFSLCRLIEKIFFFSQENDISKGYQKAIEKDIFFSLSALLRSPPLFSIRNSHTKKRNRFCTR